MVSGSLAALPHLKKDGGALINVGSDVSDDYPPLQGMYSATKHAVKGYTDALRVEIQLVDKAPVSITLIQSTAVDTPFPQHDRNFTDREPMLPKPMIEPRQVADAILHAAEHPTRDRTFGTMSLIYGGKPPVPPGCCRRGVPPFDYSSTVLPLPPRNRGAEEFAPRRTSRGNRVDTSRSVADDTPKAILDRPSDRGTERNPPCAPDASAAHPFISPPSTGWNLGGSWR